METADLVTLLRRRGRQSAGDLVRLLSISRPTLMRAVRAAGDAVVAQGRARRSAYAAGRALRGSMSPLPIYCVSRDGTPTEVGLLRLTVPDGSAVEWRGDLGWPLEGAMADGWFDGLPYPLQDLRPQGFLGRHFARRHAATLQMSEDPTRWSDDDALHALSLLGSDAPGDLIVGEAACRLWLEEVRQVRAGQAPPALGAEDVESVYPQRAEEAMACGVPGSPAGGEFPKFLALRCRPWDATDTTNTTSNPWPDAAVDATRHVPGAKTEPAQPQHVLVKFSGSDDSPGTQRWADLLVCEHLATTVLPQHLDVPAARSRIVRSGERTFLEVERFDRHGWLGRSALLSWDALDGAFFGSAGRPWTEAARKLAQRGWLGNADAARIERLWHFGRLIGNTDMHDGNLSFRSGGGPAESDGASATLSAATSDRTPLGLAPAYDMLPMRDAPLRGVELPPSAWSPTLPLPAERAAWEAAAAAGLIFWERVASDPRITAAYRDIGAQRAEMLRVLTSTGR